MVPDGPKGKARPLNSAVTVNQPKAIEAGTNSISNRILANISDLRVARVEGRPRSHLETIALTTAMTKTKPATSASQPNVTGASTSHR